jgi:hypothetical protein
VTPPVPALLAETPGIGLYAEGGLHAGLKALYACSGARLEVKVGGRVVDVVTPDEYIEIQTRNLGAIRDKILSLACLGPVRVVLPVTTERYIERLTPDQALAVCGSRRKSPLRRDFFHAFDELIHAPALVASPNIKLDIVLVRVLERRKTGSRLYRGRLRDEVAERRLEAVLARHSFESAADWLSLLPSNLPEVFGSAELGKALYLPSARARKILYTFSRCGLLVEQEQRGRQKVYCKKDITPNKGSLL